MLSLSKLLVETPEYLHNIECTSSNGIGEITTGRADGANNRDGSVALGATKRSDTTSTLVERRKLSAKVSRETLISRHFTKATRNFTKSLSPARGRVSHHGNVLTLISPILGNSNYNTLAGVSL